MGRSRHINRRDFLGGVAGAAAGLTLPHISTEVLLAAVPRKNNIVKIKGYSGNNSLQQNQS